MDKKEIIEKLIAKYEDRLTFTENLTGGGGTAQMFRGIKIGELKEIIEDLKSIEALSPVGTQTKANSELLERAKEEVAKESGYKDWNDLYNNKASLFFADSTITKVAIRFSQLSKEEDAVKKCKHPIDKRSYVGRNTLKCGVCGEEFE